MVVTCSRWVGAGDGSWGMGAKENLGGEGGAGGKLIDGGHLPKVGGSWGWELGRLSQSMAVINVAMWMGPTLMASGMRQWAWGMSRGLRGEAGGL